MSSNLSLTGCSWLYTAHLAEDANFKQKARARPNDNEDESLQPGQGAFVNNSQFTQHLEKAMQINPGEVTSPLCLNQLKSNEVYRLTIVLVSAPFTVLIRSARKV
jgi:hypothetical protein